MPKIKSLEKFIPSFYRQKTIDTGLFFHVYILAHVLKIMKIKEAIELFQEIYLKDEEYYPIDQALKNYARMRDKYLWRILTDRK